MFTYTPSLLVRRKPFGRLKVSLGLHSVIYVVVRFLDDGIIAKEAETLQNKSCPHAAYLPCRMHHTTDTSDIPSCILQFYFHFILAHIGMIIRYNMIIY